MKRATLALLGLAVLLIIGGAALLFGQPSSFFVLQPASSEVSVAYSSDLTLTFDAEPGDSDVLTGVGAALLLGGLMVSAAAIGWRSGRAGVGHE